ncbi:MAG TPA: DUF2089 domain-containing protein [Candidatus Cloacimonadota bacterium]|nr:DUF2089 domain-containing protein [Candidatus Cloacimonadota bacterium]HOD54931.1 DUF2089 domain-containing protein [Candidatus Cloacimonadota bacterium]HPM00570.1 DUF2089 domain-containing protein [Candidatus Cloacimonadota bacterium]
MIKGNQQLIKCPVCDEPLLIKEFHCDECNTTIRGNFEPGHINKLSKEQLTFVKIFLLCQGNIKEVEKKLNISYPTVKNRLAEIIDVINDNDDSSDNVISILEEIENGLVGVDEAIDKINKRRNLK